MEATDGDMGIEQRSFLGFGDDTTVNLRDLAQPVSKLSRRKRQKLVDIFVTGKES